MRLKVNASRLENELTELAEFSESSSPAVTRIVFSKQDVTARAWLFQKLNEAGLSIRVDAVGNTFARWHGSEVEASAVATGSHIDAIPNAGRFDGTVGVLGGLEAIRALKESGFVPRRSIELILFTSEEPTRFGIGCLGSRMISGVLAPDKARTLQDQAGISLDDLRQAAGFSGNLETVQMWKGHYSAFVELHIEQGPILEETRTDIGIVTGIAAPAGMRVSVTGSGGHAGAVLMHKRRDAFAGAAEMAIAVEAAALKTGSQDSVATTGICTIFPGAVNSVPSHVKLELDVRDTELARRDGMVANIADACKAIGKRRNLEVVVEMVNADSPAGCDASIVNLIENSCSKLGLTQMSMVSRAYHDSLFMSHIAPASMIFIPCHLGVSHRPDEFAAIGDIANGVSVLAHTLAALAV